MSKGPRVDYDILFVLTVEAVAEKVLSVSSRPVVSTNCAGRPAG